MVNSQSTAVLPIGVESRNATGSTFKKPSVYKQPSSQIDVSKPDPALVMAEAWKEADKRTLALCRRQQKLEARLARIVGFPPALQTATAIPSPTTTNDPSPDDTAIHLIRWQTKDAELGYSKTRATEQRAAVEQRQILDQLAETPALSLAGAIAKLEVILLEGKEMEDDPNFPWPHIRSALDDLRRMERHDPRNCSLKSGFEKAPCQKMG